MYLHTMYMYMSYYVIVVYILNIFVFFSFYMSITTTLFLLSASVLLKGISVHHVNACDLFCHCDLYPKVGSHISLLLILMHLLFQI